MANLWTVEDFKGELTHMSQLHVKRPGSAVYQSLVNTFKAKAQAVTSWTSQAIMALLTHIEGLALPENSKEEISNCLENLTLGTTNSTKLTKSSQVVHNLPAYLTQEDWTKLQSNTTIMDQLAVIAKRLAEMGVYSLKENTKQQAVALVLKTRCDQGHQEPSANIIYSWKDDFQACHTGVAKGAAPSMAMYPARPVDLGSNWLSKAYLENSQPLGKDVFIAPWMEKVAVRSTNSLLQSGGTAPKSKGFKSQSSQGNLSTIFVTAMPWSRNFFCGKTF